MRVDIILKKKEGTIKYGRKSIKRPYHNIWAAEGKLSIHPSWTVGWLNPPVRRKELCGATRRFGERWLPVIKINKIRRNSHLQGQYSYTFNSRNQFVKLTYRFVRGLLNRKKVLNARRYILDKFSAQGGILEPGENAEDGILSSRCGIGCVPFMEGKSGWTHNDVVLKGYEGYLCIY